MSNTSPQQLFSRRQFMKVVACAAAAGGMWWSDGYADASGGNSSLETEVNNYIRKLRIAGRIPSDEKTAWVVQDFTKGHKLVSINDSYPLQAASMIKPFLAQAYFFLHSMDRKHYPYDNLVKLKLKMMIRDSDNGAANFFINRVGGNRPVSQRPAEVEKILKRNAGKIFRQTSIVEFIPQNGRSYRNKASANDYSRFLQAINSNGLPHSDKIRYYMGLDNRDRIQDGSIVPNCADLYHKTGTTAHLCGDMGVLVAKGNNGRSYPYSFVGIIQKGDRAKDYGGWMRDRGNVIREVSGLVYEYMSKRYNLV